MSDATAHERLEGVGSRVSAFVVRIIAAVVVLAMFAGLAFLVYVDRVDAGALLLYAGVILGYIVHATKESL